MIFYWRFIWIICFWLGLLIGISDKLFTLDHIENSLNENLLFVEEKEIIKWLFPKSEILQEFSIKRILKSHSLKSQCEIYMRLLSRDCKTLFHKHYIDPKNFHSLLSLFKLELLEIWTTYVCEIISLYNTWTSLVCF